MRLAPTRNYHAVALSGRGVSPPSPGLFFFITPVPVASSLLSISRPKIKFALINLR